jgi:hypothetical protein
MKTDEDTLPLMMLYTYDEIASKRAVCSFPLMSKYHNR